MSTTQTIRTILAHQPNAVQVFERFRIDLCSQADQSLEQACRELQLSCDQVIEKLDEARVAGLHPSVLDPSGWTLTRLIQHIVRIHHRNVRRELPQLIQMSQKIASKRGGRAPELKQMVDLGNQLLDREIAHLHKEEQELFPVIARMDDDLDVMRPQPDNCLGVVSSSIALMRQNHETTRGTLRRIRGLANDFSAPDWACLTHHALFQRWRDFEKDMRQHIHLENDHLFPRALQRGRELSFGR